MTPPTTRGKPRLLDLFCGAGGAAMGYHRAGFEVVGVDIKPQPRYPFEFHNADAMAMRQDIIEGCWHEGVQTRLPGRLAACLGKFDAIHASPPCQSYSKALRHMATPKPMLVGDVRSLLGAAGVPWVIENVEGSPVETESTLFGSHGVMLCGSMFGLRVKRHRRFECSFPIDPKAACNHANPAMNPHYGPGREAIYEEFGRQDPERLWRKEMGVEWMTGLEGRQAIPPAYTEYIGRALLAAVEARR